MESESESLHGGRISMQIAMMKGRKEASAGGKLWMIAVGRLKLIL